MTKVTQFDGKNLKQIREAMQAALDTVAADFGITAGLGNIRYTGTEFSCKLTAATKPASNDSDGELDTANNAKWIAAFNQTVSTISGLKLNLEVLSDSGEKLVIVGARPRARANIILRRTDDKFIVAEEQTVIRWLNRK